MNKTLKKFFATLTVITIAAFLLLPATAFANEGTFGNETPYLYCTFTDGEGNICDGDHLSAGNYDVDVVLSGMVSMSVFQFTADYDTSVLTSLEADAASVFAGENGDVSLGGIKENDDGVIVFVLASTEEYCSALDADGTTLVTLNVTVECENTVDFQDIFLFNQNPDLTFAEADYRDDLENAYVPDTSIETAYQTFPMDVDESPALGADVIGKVVIANDINGTSGKCEIVGITVTVDGTEITAESADDGSYTLSQVPYGTHKVTFSGPTTIDRTATLVVSAEKVSDGKINVNDVPIVICDYNKDTRINGLDKLSFNGYTNDYNQNGYAFVYADLNADNRINSLDKLSFNAFVNQTIVYNEIIL